VIARRVLSSRYRAWNAKWGAPFGHAGRPTIEFDPPSHDDVARSAGCFGAQRNSTTRVIEFPWAFHAVKVSSGLRALEVGGALSGFQFALSASGASVINVDPFVRFGEGSEQPSDPEYAHRQMNTWFGTDVRLIRSDISKAGITSGSMDVIYSISTVEHMPSDEITHLLQEARRILRPGGRMVLTVDLFLDLHPFTGREMNKWGTNVAIAPLLRGHHMRILRENPAELLGTPGFDAHRVLRNLNHYAINEYYPQLSQLLVIAPTKE
jgi:SAM-dependent methyltransferase